MDGRSCARPPRSLAAALAGAALLLGSGGDRAIGDGLSSDTPRITAAQRDAGARFAAGVPGGRPRLDRRRRSRPPGPRRSG